jgi:hypothetical protein
LLLALLVVPAAPGPSHLGTWYSTNPGQCAVSSSTKNGCPRSLAFGDRESRQRWNRRNPPVGREEDSPGREPWDTAHRKILPVHFIRCIVDQEIFISRDREEGL